MKNLAEKAIVTDWPVDSLADIPMQIMQNGSRAVGEAALTLGAELPYEIRYMPFEHVNYAARLVIVGITPGPNQMSIAYDTAANFMGSSTAPEEIRREVIRSAGFGGSAMRPNLLRMLRHFRIEDVLKILDAESLWGENAELLHSTSVIPHAAFKKDKPFAGSFSEIRKSRLLRNCFFECFVSSLKKFKSDSLFIALGPTPDGALRWCIDKGYLSEGQYLGAFAHPSTQGGSKVSFYLRERNFADLKPRDPTRFQADWLDASYKHVARTTNLLGGGPVAIAAAA